MKKCPCGLHKNFNECCGPFIAGEAYPSTPEALMRSRYTAYTLANMDYIARTMKSPALDHFDPPKTRRWAKQVVWLKLEVLSTHLENATLGYVEFRAHYAENGKKQSIHENSEFHCDNGKWFYIKAKTPNI